MTAKPQTAKRSTPPTPERIIAEQKRQAAALKAQALTVAVKAAAGAVAAPAPDTRNEVQRYIDEVAPANIVGRMIKFSKDGKFVTADDDEPIAEAAEFIALCDEALIGWIKFHRDGETPPDRVMGLLYDGFVMPPRETLGDMDATKWLAGLSGQPEDPWKHQMCLVLQQVATGELFTYVTTSDTGRRSVGNLLRHYDRMRRAGTNEVPVVRLRAGGFNHRNPQIRLGPDADVRHRWARAAGERRQTRYRHRRRPQRRDPAPLEPVTWGGRHTRSPCPLPEPHPCHSTFARYPILANLARGASASPTTRRQSRLSPRREDKRGRGVYDCVRPSNPARASRSLKTVGEIVALHVDIDGKDLLEDLPRRPAPCRAAVAADRNPEFRPGPPCPLRAEGADRRRRRRHGSAGVRVTATADRIPVRRHGGSTPCRTAEATSHP